MRQTTLATLDAAALAAAFNRVYEAYVVPFAMDEASVRQHVRANDLALADSPLWIDEAGEVAGLAALGVRGGRGWVGGFGLAPPYRGRGLGHALMGAIVESARRRSLAQLQLEVLTNNPAAIALYAGEGFVRERTLRIFARAADVPPPHAPGAGLAHPADPATLLELGDRSRPAPPAWQREPASLAHIPGLHGLALGPRGNPDAHLLYGVSDRTPAVQVWDVAAHDPAAIDALIGALATRLPGRPLRLSNEPAESPVCAALERLGWRESLRQDEMRRPLP